MQKMPARMQRKYRQAIKRTFQARSSISVGSACSGSDVQVLIWEAFAKHLSKVARFLKFPFEISKIALPSTAFILPWASVFPLVIQLGGAYIGRPCHILEFVLVQ